MSSISASPPLSGGAFMLPICDCGGPMNLASIQPHPDSMDQELKIFRCSTCGAQRAFNGRRRTPSMWPNE